MWTSKVFLSFLPELPGQLLYRQGLEKDLVIHFDVRLGHVLMVFNYVQKSNFTGGVV